MRTFSIVHFFLASIITLYTGLSLSLSSFTCQVGMRTYHRIDIDTNTQTDYIALISHEGMSVQHRCEAVSPFRPCPDILPGDVVQCTFRDGIISTQQPGDNNTFLIIYLLGWGNIISLTIYFIYVISTRNQHRRPHDHLA
jgi:hypothetical protein